MVCIYLIIIHHDTFIHHLTRKCAFPLSISDRIPFFSFSCRNSSNYQITCRLPGAIICLGRNGRKLDFQIVWLSENKERLGRWSMIKRKFLSRSDPIYLDLPVVPVCLFQALPEFDRERGFYCSIFCCRDCYED